MQVYIAQLKCPNNHPLLSVYGEYESLEQARGLEEPLWSVFESLIDGKAVHPLCSFCGAKDTGRVEISPTVFRSMAEAAGPMREEARLQALSRALLRGMRN